MMAAVQSTCLVAKTAHHGSFRAVAPKLPQAPFRPCKGRSQVVVSAKYTKERSDVNAQANAQTEELQAKVNEYIDIAKDKWERTEEKPAAVAITVAAIIAVWAASGVVDAVDKLPLVGGGLELVGLIVTAWFTYRYLIFGPDREELLSNIDSFWQKVSGK